MTLSVQCECGKVNFVNPSISEDRVYCMLCTRPIPVAHYYRPSPAKDPYGLVGATIDEREVRRRKLEEQIGPAPQTNTKNPREYFYWLLPLALIPLLLISDRPPDDAKKRYDQTVDALPEHQREYIRKLEKDPRTTLEDILERL